MAVKADGRLVNQAEMAQISGVQALTIRNWERKGCPVRKKGGRGKPAQYNTAEVMRWREEQVVLAAAGDLDAMDFEEARRRKLAAEAALAELDLSVRTREFVPIEEVGAQVAEEYANVRAKFLSLPGDVAADMEGLTTSEIQELLASKVSEILHELSADDDYVSENEIEEGEA